MNILLRMDDAGLIDDMKKIPLQNYIFSLRISFVQKQIFHIIIIILIIIYFISKLNYTDSLLGGFWLSLLKYRTARFTDSAHWLAWLPQRLCRSLLESRLPANRLQRDRGWYWVYPLLVHGDPKEKIQCHLPSHRQTSTAEYQIKISHREDRK